MFSLWVTLGALAIAPLLDAALRDRGRLAAFGDGFVQVIVVGLLLTQVVPEGIAQGGWFGVVALAAGLGAAAVAHRLPGGERTVAGLALLGLVAHGLGDGLALATAAHGAGVLGAAVVLHTLPVGLATWRVAVDYGGRRSGALALGVTAAATLTGFGAGAGLEPLLPEAGLAVVQCAVAGSLLHVVGHHASSGPARAAGWGGVSGAAVVVAVAATHGLHPWIVPAELALEAAPALLLGYVVAGALHAAWPDAAREGDPRAPGRWLRGRTAVGTAARGAALGVVAPVCSCGALPVYRTLHGRGVDPRAGLAFLVAGPELGVTTLLVSVPLLGWPLTAVRLAAALAVGVLAGVVVGGRVPRLPAPPASVAPGASAPERLRRGVRFGLVDSVDHTAVWVLAGLWIAALVQPLLAGPTIAAVPSAVQVVLAAAIGVPAYVCASGATPVVAALIGSGVSPGAGVAFLLTGPATNVSTFGVLGRMHGAPVAVGFGAVVAGAAVAVGFAVDAAGVAAGPALAAPLEHGHGPVAFAALAALVVLFLASFVRQGPHGFVEPLLHPFDPGHEHSHGHGHRHEHEHAH